VFYKDTIPTSIFSFTWRFSKELPGIIRITKDYYRCHHAKVPMTTPILLSDEDDELNEPGLSA
jgi:hypothetical protein